MTTEARVKEYEDAVHAEVLDDLQVGDHGYKYRVLDGVVMPPYITPGRYQTSRELVTRPDDVCFVSFPKSGSTWLSYILVLALHGGQEPEGQTLRSSLHWVASSWTYPRSRAELDAMPSPRIFKSHMPVQMALGGGPTRSPCRYIYIARNPKDVVTSYYFFERGKSWAGGYSGPWPHWFRMFMDGQVQRGSWFEHVAGWWESAHLSNVLFLTYEDLLEDMDAQLIRLSDFLGLDLDEAQRRSIREKTAFDQMRSAEYSNLRDVKEFREFFRRGVSGTWRDQLTPEQSAEIDERFRERFGQNGLRLKGMEP